MQSFLLAVVAMVRGNIVLLITISFLVNRSGASVDEKIEKVKQYILNQLDYSQPPPNASDSATPKDKLTEYRMQMHREDSTDKYCNELDTHAKSIFTMGGQVVALQSNSESGSGIDKRGMALIMFNHYHIHFKLHI